MGAVTADDIGRAMIAVAETMAEMGIASFGRSETVSERW
jgi:hypothetical protein